MSLLSAGKIIDKSFKKLYKTLQLKSVSKTTLFETLFSGLCSSRKGTFRDKDFIRKFEINLYGIAAAAAAASPASKGRILLTRLRLTRS